jgi:predicted acylesterase/phospholipase RssA
MNNYKHLVVSGGSKKGFYALGTLQYCLDNFYLTRVNFFYANSIGAIILYLTILDYTPIEIITWICVNKIFENIPQIDINGIYNGQGSIDYDKEINIHLQQMTLKKIGRLLTLQELYDLTGKKLTICTYNITDNVEEYISIDTYPTIPCLTALRMSCNLPIIFGNFQYMGKFYIDGYCTNNFPIDIADKIASKNGDQVLGINMTVENVKNLHEKSIPEYMYHVASIPIMQLIKLRIENVSENCDIIEISDPNTDINPFDLNLTARKKLDYFSIGYNKGKEYFEAI